MLRARAFRKWVARPRSPDAPARAARAGASGERGRATRPPTALALEDLSDGHAEAGQQRPTVQFIRLLQDAGNRGRVIDVDLLLARDDDPDLLNPDLKILVHLRNHILEEIVGA